MVDTSSSSPERRAGVRLLAIITIAGTALLAVTAGMIARSEPGTSAASDPQSTAPSSRRGVAPRIADPAPARARHELVTPPIVELHQPPAPPVAHEVPREVADRIDALALRIRDETGPARKAAIHEAMRATAELPPEAAAAALARLDATAAPPADETGRSPGTPRAAR